MTIAASVTNIGQDAFVSCAGLTSVYFNGNAPTADFTVFHPDTKATAYYLPGTTGWDVFSRNTGVPTALWNPTIQTGDGSFGVRNNQFGFNIAGTTNIRILVEACTNLACPVWTPIQPITLTNGSFYFSEAVQQNLPGSFYRIRSP